MSSENHFLSLAVVTALVFSVLGSAEQGQDHEPEKSKLLNLSRPIDVSKRMTGTIVFKAIDSERLWPFFVVSKDGEKIEYKIEACDQTCKAEIGCTNLCINCGHICRFRQGLAKVP